MYISKTNEKILITGTGRSGTTLLMNLFTHLDFETGWSREDCIDVTNRKERAGLEYWHLDNYITKNPQLYEHIPTINEKYNLEHIIIPIRNLESTAKSRELLGKGKAGGFWAGNETADEQLDFNAKLLYKLIRDISVLDISYTTIPFPEFAHNKEIIWKKLDWLFGKYNVSYDVYSREFNNIVDVGKISFK